MFWIEQLRNCSPERKGKVNIATLMKSCYYYWLKGAQGLASRALYLKSCQEVSLLVLYELLALHGFGLCVIWIGSPRGTMVKDIAPPLFGFGNITTTTSRMTWHFHNTTVIIKTNALSCYNCVCFFNYLIPSGYYNSEREEEKKVDTILNGINTCVWFS